MPDIIALQEVRHNWRDLPGHNQARWLAEQLGYHWIFRPAHTFWAFPPIVEGLAFLSKQPLETPHAYRVEPVPWAGPHRVFLAADAGGMSIINVHFPLTNRAREAAAHQLVAVTHCLRDYSVLALGDFNADSDQRPMQILRDAGFIDLWQEGGDQSWPQRRRIDYALGRRLEASKTIIKAVGAATEPGQYPSDHPGILLDLD